MPSCPSFGSKIYILWALSTCSQGFPYIELTLAFALTFPLINLAIMDPISFVLLKLSDCVQRFINRVDLFQCGYLFAQCSLECLERVISWLHKLMDKHTSSTIMHWNTYIYISIPVMQELTFMACFMWWEARHLSMSRHVYQA